MKRRTFITLLGGGAASFSSVALNPWDRFANAKTLGLEVPFSECHRLVVGNRPKSLKK
jgi:hypothetical protein